MNYNSSFSGLGRAVLAFLLCPALATLSRASVPIGKSNIQIGGFFSQGYIESYGNNYPVEAKGGTFDLREMAVNLSMPIGSHLRVGAQGFAQSLGNYGEDRPILDWANADYNFCQEFGVRVGRVKFPRGLYGEALDLDMIRPFIFLPQALYNSVTRDFNASFDGAMIYGSLTASKAGSFDYKVFYGDIPMNTHQGVADFFTNTGLYAAPGVQTLGMDYATGAQVFWNTPVSGLRLGTSYSYLSKVFGNGKFALVPFPVFGVEVVGDKYTSTTLSAEYAWKDWTFAAEWERTGDTFTVSTPPPAGFGIPAPPSSSVDTGATSWYTSAAWRINSRFELGTYYSKQNMRFVQPGTPKAQQHLDDWALSLRFDLNEHVLFKIEAHQVNGRMGVFNTPRTPNPTKKDDSSYFAAKTTISF